jgi:hypothetical protein
MSDAMIEIERVKRRDGIPSDDPWQDWSGLRELLRARFEQEHRLEDLDEIIRTDLRLLIGAKPKSDASTLGQHAMRLGFLAIAFSDRAERTLASWDNARALYFRRLALAIIPAGLVHLRAVIHSQLGLSLLIRAEQKRDKSLMDEAYVHAHTATRLNTQRHGIA